VLGVRQNFDASSWDLHLLIVLGVRQNFDACSWDVHLLILLGVRQNFDACSGVHLMFIRRNFNVCWGRCLRLCFLVDRDRNWNDLRVIQWSCKVVQVNVM
jgi:hypothetical protein